MEELKSMISGLVKSVNEIKEQMNNNHEDLKGEITKNTTSIEQLKRDYEEKEISWQQEKREMNREIELLKKRIEDQDRRNRAKNIVIIGLCTEEKRPKEVVSEWLEKELLIKCQIKSASVLARNEHISTILVELENAEDKTIIMRNKHKLQGRKIYINNDCTKDERDMQVIIRRKAKEERTQGKNVKIFHNRLLVNGMNIMWNAKNKVWEEQNRSENTKIKDSKNL